MGAFDLTLVQTDGGAEGTEANIDRVRRNRYVLGGLLVAATLVAYVPALRAGYIWDDDAHVTENPTLTSLAGLRAIWLDPGALPQYYPLVHTTFWIERRLWGLAPLGYHLINVLLHAFNALLLARTAARGQPAASAPGYPRIAVRTACRALREAPRGRRRPADRALGPRPA